MKTQTRRILALLTSLVILLSLSPIQALAETYTFELFSLPAPMPEYFEADTGSYTDLTNTSSINSHTYPRHIWVQDGYVYFAGWVQHTKEFNIFTIEGLSPAPGDYAKMTSPGDTLTIGGTNVSSLLPGSSSNVWWVARFPVDMITLDGAYTYDMVVGAPGHDITGGTVVGSMTIDKTADTAVYHDGDTITYSIVVKNNSNVSITSVQVTDTSTAINGNVPRTLAYPAGFTGTLAAGASVTFTYTYTTTAADVAAGQIVNQARVTGVSGEMQFDVSDVVTIYAIGSYSGTKTWVDNNNAYGTRPASLKLTLHKTVNGATSPVAGAVPSWSNTATSVWTYTFNELARVENNQLVTYSVTEEPGDVPAGYQLTSADGRHFVNTLAPGSTSVSGTKTWVDNNNAYLTRPESLALTLHADGVPLDPQPAPTWTKSGNSWVYTFNNLPKYRNGELIVYHVTETEPSGYVKTSTDHETQNRDFTNELAAGSITISGTKTWDDGNNQDGQRPAAITINLKNGAVVVRSIELDGTADLNGESAAWAYVFSGLPKFASGVLIPYTVEETDYAPYTPGSITQPVMSAGVNSYTVDITNSFTPETVDISGTKTWDDNNDQDGIRPESITVKLLADEVEVDEATVSAPWTYSFTGLPKYHDGGTLIAYTVEEDPVDGYTPAVTGHNIKNSHTPETVDISGTKTWNDNNDQDGIRPETITVKLLADEVEVDEATVSAPWTYSFTGLPKYRDGGTLIEYTVEEEPVDGYEPGVTGFNIKNSHTAETVDISGTKTWDDNNDQDGIRPETITVKLLADNVEVDEATVSSPWTYSFTGLPKYRDGGTLIEYAVEEEPVDGYTPAVTGHNIKNSHTPETVDISGTKTWDDSDDQDGIRPETITVKLLADEVEVDEVTVSAPWTYSFTGLPKYRDGGTLIAYTVEEEPVEGYTPAVTGHNIKNSHTPETVDISGAKTWDDNNDQDGIRPETITVKLLADNVEVDEVTVSAPWTYSFTGLPKYRDGGTLIAYTVEEEPVDGYEPAVTGHDIKNSHTPETTSITVTKVWADRDDEDGKRPASLRITLTGSDGVPHQAEMTGSGNTWTHSFTDLPVYKEGAAINYHASLTEESLEALGYTSKVDLEGLTLTNTRGAGSFDPDSAEAGLNPTKSLTGRALTDNAFTFQLRKGDALIEQVKNTADGNIPFSRIHYTQHDIGEHRYTIHEVAGGETGMAYDPMVLAFTVVVSDLGNGKLGAALKESPNDTVFNNAYKADDEYPINGKGDISINPMKELTGRALKEGEFEFVLKHGGAVLQTVRNTAAGMLPFAPIPYTEEDIGQTYTYTITETAGNEPGMAYDMLVMTFSVTVSDAGDGKLNTEAIKPATTVFTNTAQPQLQNITVRKQWEDKDNAAGERPDSIRVQLIQNGAPYGQAVTITSAAWEAAFNDLPVLDEQGTRYTYTVRETTEARNYTATYRGLMDNTLVIVNTYVKPSEPGLVSSNLGETFE